jgi:hypothetical protein
LALSDEEVAKRRAKSRVRAHAEHPFRILKCVFGFRKVYCRGIAKNLNRLQVSFALVNLCTKQRQLLRNAAARRQSSARIRKGWLISPPIVTKCRSLENTKTAKKSVQLFKLYFIQRFLRTLRPSPNFLLKYRSLQRCLV